MGDVSVIMAGITMKGPSIIQTFQVLGCHQYTKHTLCNRKENMNRSASFLSSCPNISTTMSKSPVTSFPVIRNLRPRKDMRHVSLTCILTSRSRLTRHHHIFLWIVFLSPMYLYFLRFIPSVNSLACPTMTLHSHTIIYSSSLSLSYSFMHLPMKRSLPYQRDDLTSE